MWPQAIQLAMVALNFFALGLQHLALQIGLSPTGAMNTYWTRLGLDLDCMPLVQTAHGLACII